MSLILGLTGTMGSGKTFVSSLFSLCNAKVICADALAREATKPGSPALQEIAKQFGSGILHPDGSLNRSALAGIVFADSSRRISLEKIIHPLVRERERQLLQEYRDSPLVILDVPLLFETGLDRECDRTAVVVVDEATREERLRSSRSMTHAEFHARSRSQWTQEEKVARADEVIDNSSTRQHTARQVKDLIARLFPKGLPAPLRELPIQEI